MFLSTKVHFVEVIYQQHHVVWIEIKILLPSLCLGERCAKSLSFPFASARQQKPKCGMTLRKNCDQVFKCYQLYFFFDLGNATKTSLINNIFDSQLSENDSKSRTPISSNTNTNYPKVATESFVETPTTNKKVFPCNTETSSGSSNTKFPKVAT